jgi:acyl-ACP thioesterase
MSLPERPSSGRLYRAKRRVRLSDTDAGGRLRLDAIARYLQDVASDDVADAGWSSDEHVWVVRRTELELVSPFAGDEEVELATWCSGVGASAAARRTTIEGDRGGRVEAEVVWIHLDHDLRPLRLPRRFHDLYTPAAAGRGVSTKLTLRGPNGGTSRPWPLRATDVDLLGHVNNAVYWAAVEELLWPLRRAVLEYRQPVDLGDAVELRAADGSLAFVVDGDLRAAASAS